MVRQSKLSNQPKQILLTSINLKLFGSLIAITIGVLGYLVYNTHFSTAQSEVKTSQDIIAKVGQEVIYRQSVNKLVASNKYNYQEYPIDREKVLADELISSSIILQGAAADQLISLDPPVFNSPSMDVNKRFELVKKAQAAVDEMSGSIDVTVFSIWFNDPSSPSADYKVSKNTAYQRLNTIFNKVKRKQVTPEQALDELRADTSLTKIDPNYQSRIGTRMMIKSGNPITFDEDFDNILWNLSNGEISDIFLAKSNTFDTQGTITGQKVETAYLFGVVHNKKTGTYYQNYNQWLEEKKKQYEVIRY